MSERRYIAAGKVHVEARQASTRTLSLCGKRHMPGRTTQAEPTCDACRERMKRDGQEVA